MDRRTRLLEDLEKCYYVLFIIVGIVWLVNLIYTIVRGGEFLDIARRIDVDISNMAIDIALLVESTLRLEGLIEAFINSTVPIPF